MGGPKGIAGKEESIDMLNQQRTSEQLLLSLQDKNFLTSKLGFSADTANWIIKNSEKVVATLPKDFIPKFVASLSDPTKQGATEADMLRYIQLSMDGFRKPPATVLDELSGKRGVTAILGACTLAHTNAFGISQGIHLRDGKDKEAQQDAIQYHNANELLRKNGLSLLSQQEELKNLAQKAAEGAGLSLEGFMKQYGVKMMKQALEAGYSQKDILTLSLSMDHGLSSQTYDPQFTAQVALTNLQCGIELINMLTEYIRNETDRAIKAKLEKMKAELEAQGVGEKQTSENEKDFKKKLDKVDDTLEDKVTLKLVSALHYHASLGKMVISKNQDFIERQPKMGA